MLLELRASVDAGTFDGDRLTLGILATRPRRPASRGSSRAPAPPTPCSPRRRRMIRAASRPSASGSSTRSTAPASSRSASAMSTCWRDDFAVHVALWARGRGLVAGAVGLPPGRRSPHRCAARRSSRAPSRRSLTGAPLRLAVSRTRPPAVAARLGERPDVELVPMGSNGVRYGRPRRHRRRLRP